MAVNLCRSEESARSGERSLGEASKVSSIQSQSNRRPDRPANVSKPSCGKCGRFAHATGVICPAIAGSCHLCNAIGHFSPCCPKKTATTAAKPAAASASVKPADPTVKVSERRVVISAKIAIVYSVTARSAPVISVDVYDMKSKDFIATIDSAIPDGGEEVTVAGLDVLKALGLSEHDFCYSRYELVQASKSSRNLRLSMALARQTSQFPDRDSMNKSIINSTSQRSPSQLAQVPFMTTRWRYYQFPLLFLHNHNKHVFWG